MVPPIDNGQGQLRPKIGVIVQPGTTLHVQELLVHLKSGQNLGVNFSLINIRPDKKDLFYALKVISKVTNEVSGSHIRGRVHYQQRETGSIFLTDVALIESKFTLKVSINNNNNNNNILSSESEEESIPLTLLMAPPKQMGVGENISPLKNGPHNGRSFTSSADASILNGPPTTMPAENCEIGANSNQENIISNSNCAFLSANNQQNGTDGVIMGKTGISGEKEAVAKSPGVCQAGALELSDDQKVDKIVQNAITGLLKETQTLLSSVKLSPQRRNGSIVNNCQKSKCYSSSEFGTKRPRLMESCLIQID